MPKLREGLVSVVLVNFRGADDTLDAIAHLALVEWPSERLEIVVVDNASSDGSADRIREAAPQVRLVEAATNLGFAGGCNLGVASSHGEFVAFLNSDAKPDRYWISAAIAAFGDSSDIAAVASRVLDWEGKTVDFIDSSITWFGMGYKPSLGDAATTIGNNAKDVLFGTGAAMFIRRSTFDSIGGFDERLFMFFEDVDLGWRLNLLGWRVRYVPESVAYHRHHGAVDKFGSFRESFFLERNALVILYKNLSRKRLDAVLPAALGLAIRRGIARGGLDASAFDFRNEGGDDEPSIQVSKQALAPVFGVDQFVAALPGLADERDTIQRTRVVSDSGLWRLFGRVDVVSYKDPGYLEGYETLVEAFPVATETLATRVLIITGDPIGAKLAGPAIRAFTIARALSERNEVALLTMSTLEEMTAPFTLAQIRAGDNRAFAPWEKWADVIVFQGHAMAAFPAIADTDKIVVADVYDPVHLEQLEQARELPYATWVKQVGDATATLNQQLAAADFMICASERQRLFYLGQLAALGRLSPATYEDDPDFRRLIDVVPFGLDEVPPEHEQDVLRGVLPGISSDDKILVWGGGLYNWFDPKTLIRAVAKLSTTQDRVRLFFLGTKHPHPGVPEMAVVSESRELARELGVEGTAVFFNDSWVAFADRQNYLLESDAGVSTHFSHIETTFSFRTRILDYLWAGLPMVVTEGDAFAELVEQERLGIVVPATDVDALADALERVLFDDSFAEECRANVARAREQFYWGRVLAPLVAFIDDPSHARDRESKSLRADRASTGMRRKPYGFRHDVALVAHHLRSGGVRVVVSKVLVRMRQR
ncbi:MAG: glycosyltransferase [Candidatus Saccharibacteria bacterium]|nr:glycosyltransferase [Microbacteriaceae bacterium]